MSVLLINKTSKIVPEFTIPKIRKLKKTFHKLTLLSPKSRQKINRQFDLSSKPSFTGCHWQAGRKVPSIDLSPRKSVRRWHHANFWITRTFPLANQYQFPLFPLPLLWGRGSLLCKSSKEKHK